MNKVGRIKDETDIASLPTTMIRTRESERYHEESWGDETDIAGLPTTMIRTRESERYHEERWGRD